MIEGLSLESFGLGGGGEPDSDLKKQWLEENSIGASGGKGQIDPKANSSQAGSASGNGGVVGPISAAVGDINASLGGSADGDNSFEFGDFATGRNKTIIQTSGINSFQLAVIGIFAFLALKMTRNK